MTTFTRFILFPLMSSNQTKRLKQEMLSTTKSKCEMDNQNSTHQRSNPSPFQAYISHNIGQHLCLYQLNIEGASRVKIYYISHSAADLNVDIILLQETHINDPSSASRLHINEFWLIAAVYHAKYGVATYVRNKLTNYTVLRKSCSEKISVTTIRVGDKTISNVYKPPQVQWALPALQIYVHPEVHIGDYNSQHPNWRYSNSDEAGEQLLNWSSSSDHYLYFDAKQPRTFLSARWGIVSNPDLCFVSIDCQERPC